MGEAIWEYEGVAVSWYTGPVRDDLLSRRRFVITRRTNDHSPDGNDAVDLSWGQWLSLWRWMASQDDPPGGPGSAGPSIFMVDHAKSDKDFHLYCVECFDRIPGFLRRSWVEVASHKASYDWTNPVTCEGCSKAVLLKECT